jgi:hypothetical protein
MPSLPKTSPDLLVANLGWHLVGKVGSSYERSHVPAQFHDESGVLDNQRAVTTRSILRLGSFLELFKVGAQQLL